MRYGASRSWQQVSGITTGASGKKTHPGKVVSDVIEGGELGGGFHALQATAHGQVPGTAHPVHALGILGLQVLDHCHQQVVREVLPTILQSMARHVMLAYNDMKGLQDASPCAS